MDSKTMRVRNDAGEVSFLRLLALVIRYRWWIVAGAVLFALYAWFKAAQVPTTYTATASFVPQGRRSTSAVSGLAAQFGFSSGGSEGTQSPQFYVDLVSSGEILRPIVDSVVTFRSDTGVVSEPLIDYLEPGKGRTLSRIEAAVRDLRGMISAGSSAKTGVITLSVRSSHRELCQEIASRLLDRINTFYLDSRIEQAVTERRFTAARLAEVQADLRAAENRLLDFLQSNRDYLNSAQLTFEHTRLTREVDMRQQVYTALAQANEQARIEELRDTPTITILEHPQLPVLADPRTSARKIIFAGMLGAGLAFLLGLLRDVFGHPSSDEPGDEDLALFRAAVQSAVDDIRHPGRKLRKRAG